MAVQNPGTRPLIRRSAYAPLAVLLGLAVIVFVVLAVEVAGTRTPNAVDSDVAGWLGRHIGDTTATALLILTEPPLMIGSVAVVAIGAALVRRWDTAVFAAVTTPLAVAASSIVLKPIIDRQFGIVQPTGLEYGYAFPSGHETMTVSALLVLVLLLWRTTVSRRAKAAGLAVAVLWAVLAAAGLVRNGYHYATDTVGGVCIAAVVTVAVALAVDAVTARSRASSPGARSPSRTPRAA